MRGLNVSLGFQALVLAGWVTVLGACKPDGGSDLESLDNFTKSKSDQSLVACHGAGPLFRDVDETKPEAAILPAIPLAVQMDFYRSYQGTIVIVDDIGSACRSIEDINDKTQYARSTKYSGCYQILKPTSLETRTRFVMYLPQDGVAQNLVRLFGLFASELVVNRTFPSDIRSPAIVTGISEEQQKWDLLGLAEAFLDDVAQDQASRAKALAALAQNFVMSPELRQIVTAWQVGSPTSRRDFAAYTGSDKHDFIQRLFAESFDSWYCHAEKTRDDQMKLKFPNSYRAFSAMALDMAKFSEQLMADGYGKGTQRVDVPRQVSQASRSPMGQLASSYPGEGFYLQNGASIRARLQARADLGFTAVEQAARDHEISGLRLTQGGVLGFVLNLFSGLGRALFPKAAQQPAQGRGQPTYGQPTYRQPTGSGQSPFVGSGGTGRDVGETDTGIGGGTSVGGGDSSFSAEVLALTNQYRRDAGRPALVDSPQLIEECKRQVQAQAAQCSFSNFGQQCHCIADQCNGHAENIGIGYTTAQAAAEGWKNSSGHYANMIGNHRTHGAAEFNGHTCQRFGS